jgi:hypothetical protein
VLKILTKINKILNLKEMQGKEINLNVRELTFYLDVLLLRESVPYK